MPKNIPIDTAKGSSSSTSNVLGCLVVVVVKIDNVLSTTVVFIVNE